jgi:hypothetical protein
MGMNPKFADYASFEMAIAAGELDRDKTKLWISSSNCSIWEWDNETPDIYEEERQGRLLVELGWPAEALYEIAKWNGILAEET